MVSGELLKELTLILKDDFKIEYSPQESSQIAGGLLNFFDLLAKENFRMGVKREWKK